jgi:DNA topoisomerase II
VTRSLFHEDDDALLNYLEEEGQSIEPDYYLPIVPLSLVNGAEGIGTGWSTYIPGYNPRDIVSNLKRMMRGEDYHSMVPWYKGFQGVIEQQAPQSKNYFVKGVYNILSDDEFEITELPIGKWTRDYKNFLEELATKDEVEEIREYHQENRVHFVLKVPKLQDIIRGEGIEKKFKLVSSISANNYVLFDFEGKIRRYASEEDILREFYVLRLQLYERRKAYLLARLNKEFETISNKVRFILGVISEEIKVSRVKKRVLIAKLKSMGFKTASELNEILPEKKRPSVEAVQQ